MKQFLKKCTVGNYCRKIRIIVDKIEENSKHIKEAQKKISFQLQDAGAIRAWESNMQNSGTPLQKFYDNLTKINNMQIRRNQSKNHDLADKLPSIKKIKRPATNGTEKLELFPSDSEVEDEVIPETIEPPKKKIKKVKKTPKKIVSDEIIDEKDDKIDELQEFDMKDW